ncbi:uncharacterized protein LOC34618162 [Cyclospora cayetanensis]|uniref:Uncharacterized protein LOC34618162 n=1 Tax=Cyclospora cayetanensis TaxID=88456 RepID=A0A6P6RXV1_9EIME|nr:uncharacterized protein LOC34618162 [Cyclospora cayetanensis]
MAKGLRCKTKRAFRAVKRQHVSATVEATRMETLQQRLLMIQRGEDPMAFSRRPLNKFLYPDAADAVFPQKTPGARPLDFRSEALPLAGMVGWGQRKKYTEEEKIELVSLFNCLPGRTEGPEVQGAREAFKRRAAAAFVGEADMTEAACPRSSSSSAEAAAAEQADDAGATCMLAEDATSDMLAEDAASDMLADMRRRQVPVVKDGLIKQKALPSKAQRKRRQKERSLYAAAAAAAAVRNDSLFGGEKGEAPAVAVAEFA